jgi:hypothetical protein
MKPINKQFILSLQMFPYECFVAINKTPEDVQKQLTKYKRPLSDELFEVMKQKKIDTACFLFNTEFNVSTIFVNASSEYKAIVLFEHEKIHFLHHVFSVIGMKLSDETEETYAYAAEYLTAQFLKKIHE